MKRELSNPSKARWKPQPQRVASSPAKAKPSTGFEVYKNDESVIDLTEDAEDSAREEENAPVPASTGKGKGKGKRKGKDKAITVKEESMKRAADASKQAQESGDVQVASKPIESMDEITRPSKRTKVPSESSASRKGPAPAGGADQEEEEEEEAEDIEVVGTKGGSELPHNRFSCPKNTFAADDKAAHEERCKLCYCYVCDSAVDGTLNFIADFKVYNNHKMSSADVREQKKEQYLLKSHPHLHKTPAGGGKVNVTVATKRDPTLGPVANPWHAKWTPGQALPAAVRLGRLSGVGFTIWTPKPHLFSSSSSPQLIAKRKAFFDRFVSPTPLPISVWAEETPVSDPGCFKLDKPEDEKLFEVLAKAHKRQLIDVELKAEYRSDDNRGSFTVDVVLLSVLLHRTKLAERSGSSKHDADGGIDFVRVVERLVLMSVFEKTKITANAPASSPASSPSSNAAAAATTPSAPKNKPNKANPNPGVSATTSSSSSSAAAAATAPAAAGAPSSSTYTSAPPPKKKAKKAKPNPRNFFATTSPSSTTAAAAAAVAAATPSAATSSSFENKMRKAMRHREKASTITPSTEPATEPAAEPAPGSTNTESSQPWECPACTLANPGGGDKCARCGLARSAEAAAKGASGGGGGGGAGGAEAKPDVGVAAAGGAVVGGQGRVFTPSQKARFKIWVPILGCGGRASTDVSLQGLIRSVRVEERDAPELANPGQLLKVLENLQHGAVVKQPDCLTVQLFEHQLQSAQFMYDQEMLDGGVMQHLWAELPPHPQAPAGGDRACEFRPCWFSPVLNRFTTVNPFTAGIKGGLLCDEMGLGKTAATLTLHLLNPPNTPSDQVPLDEKEWGPITGEQAAVIFPSRDSLANSKRPGAFVSRGTLVVCKVSLVGQWVEEAKRLCGGQLSIYPYHGGNRKKCPEFLAKFDMVVTTYDVVRFDAMKNKGYPPLRQIRWWRVVLDESHTIAKGSQATTALGQLVANRRWCMTGTPCNVKFSDLNRQLGFSGATGAFRDRDMGEKRQNPETQAEVLAFLRRVVLRHSQGMKLGANSLLGLPTITHKVEVLQLPKKELDAYHKFEKVLQKEYLTVRNRLLHSRGSHTMAVLTLLTKFRQACSGGQLLVGQSAPVDVPGTSVEGPAQDGQHEGQEEDSEDSGDSLGWSHVQEVGDKDEKEEGEDDEEGEGEEDSDADKCAATAESMDAFCSVCHELLDSPVKTSCGHVFCQVCITGALTQGDDDEGACPKCKKPDPSSKSLVFSQYNSSLEWLKHALPKKGFEFRTLTGGMSRKQRTASLQAFASDPPTTVFLLSVRAGAVGINLTQANHIFLLEPLLNLALEKQAIGRVHRLGQTRPVTVTKLVLENSVETRILAMQERQASGSGSAGSSSTAQSGISGSLARDVAKHLKVEEYNALFGVDDDEGVSEQKPGSSAEATKKGWWGW
eukprot:g13549.t1